MKKPVLYVFLISHYCEKARWALDYCGIDYQLKTLMPATHSKVTQRIGAKGSGLPILQTQSEVIQGSAAIIDWAQKKAQENDEHSLLVNAESNALEKKADDVLGIHIRRWFYSEALVDCPEIVKPVFSKGASLKDKFILQLAWPKIVSVMIKKMDLGYEQEQESKKIVLAELDKLDSLLTGSPKYLVDNQFSNADIALASLIAPFFRPKEHPASSVFNLPPRIQQELPSLEARPSSQWLNALYRNKR